MADMTIALLGQPNSGKSTLFNALTGARQHVGNWPGKTVERCVGSFKRNGKEYAVVDLPGTYSLAANSDEEIVTRDYIAGGEADTICILADASQLSRSLFMLADYAGTKVPAILLLNMMDVAEGQGKEIDAKAIEKRLGIPVIPFVASDDKNYEVFYEAIEKGGKVIDADELAKICGVSRQTISAIEKGDYNPTINLCIKVCRVLGKTLDELFWTEEEID